MEPAERPLPPDVFIEVISGENEGLRFPIETKTVTVGRDEHCDLQLSDPYVSNKHCQIVFRADHFTVVDLGSLNKTRIKGKTYIQKNLTHGALMELGKTRMRFVWESAAAWRREHALPEEEPDGEEDQRDTPAPALEEE
jgi:pSer/pThr/pTyr-binding forkhead associated (FHA) protein